MFNVIQRFDKHSSCHLQGECALVGCFLKALYIVGGEWDVIKQIGEVEERAAIQSVLRTWLRKGGDIKVLRVTLVRRRGDGRNLKIAAAMFAETLDNVERSMRLISENQSLTLNSSHKNLRTRNTGKYFLHFTTKVRVHELHDEIWYFIKLPITCRLISVQIETIKVLTTLRAVLSLVWFLSNKINVCLGRMRKIHTFLLICVLPHPSSYNETCFILHAHERQTFNMMRMGRSYHCDLISAHGLWVVMNSLFMHRHSRMCSGTILCSITIEGQLQLS
jgi:hypothetical protein